MYKYILLDLDGTITDPEVGITKSVQYALKKSGIIENDLKKLVPFIGPPLMASFRERYGLGEAAARRAVGYYREYFVQTGMFENAVFDSVPQMLDMLRQSGKILVLATSKPTVYSETILRHFSLFDFFSLVVGSNLDGTRVEKGEVIEYALAQLPDIDRRQAVMVGDRRHDVEGAKQNGLASVAVTFGYGTREELTAANPDYMVDSMEELGTLLMG